MSKKKFKVTLELTVEELQLIQHGWRSYYYDGERLNIGRELKPKEDRRDGWYEEVEKTRKILNSLPQRIFDGLSVSAARAIEKPLKREV